MGGDGGVGICGGYIGRHRVKGGIVVGWGVFFGGGDGLGDVGQAVS